METSGKNLIPHRGTNLAGPVGKTAAMRDSLVHDRRENWAKFSLTYCLLAHILTIL
jgi:hypothetical protein